ncbi:sugar ABC transporter ATP-binding protein [Capillimicrobium parvum]|uniref:sugar ABC transporter ATP-binding protein n=1 Tax=Capillimicrobium parvum TaxID=2884022 RepID=UPI00216B6338|nr:sugar ABC transporter ATP-binding protein [Capillimicrobium parvum]
MQALAGATFEVDPGEVHALLGANGAGKSTLVKILAGGERPTSGTLRLDGAPTAFKSVEDAARRGVALVSQELNLFPALDGLHNLFLMREPVSGHVAISRRGMRERAQRVVRQLGLAFDLERPVGELALGEQQLVEIARALLGDPRILILDEPTSALSADETARLLGVIRSLREHGVGIVFVSHFLEDVFEVADAVTILRGGRVVVARRPVGELTVAAAVDGMLGEAAAAVRSGASPPQVERTIDRRDEAALRLADVSIRRKVRGVTLDAHPGEIVGLAGLEGSGVQAILRMLFGVERPMGGRVVLPGGGPCPRGIAEAIRAGVAFVPADRKQTGLHLEKPIAENISLVSSCALRRDGLVIRNGPMAQRAETWRDRLRVAMASPWAPVGALSGGNQQKVLFAKWLETGPSLMLLDDPTRGVDVGAKAEMQGVIRSIAEGGTVVLYTSSDLQEMAALCDRVLVFYQGDVMGELGRDELSEHGLLQAVTTGELV